MAPDLAIAANRRGRIRTDGSSLAKDFLAAGLSGPGIHRAVDATDVLPDGQQQAAGGHDDEAGEQRVLDQILAVFFFPKLLEQIHCIFLSEFVSDFSLRNLWFLPIPPRPHDHGRSPGGELKHGLIAGPARAGEC